MFVVHVNLKFNVNTTGNLQRVVELFEIIEDKCKLQI